MNPANKTSDKESWISDIIKDFFNNLNIQNQYYSIKLKQPIFLVGEKDLYLAIKEAIEKSKETQQSQQNNQSKQAQENYSSKFKQLSQFSSTQLYPQQ